MTKKAKRSLAVWQASSRFKKAFLIRFIIYIMIFTGLLATLADFAPILGAEFDYRRDQLFGIKHVIAPTVITSSGESSTPSASTPSTTPQSQPLFGFGGLPDNNTETITPVSTDFGIVIEKINANARVIPDVDPSNEAEYSKALAEGVAEAKGSTPPGKPGNLFIFSHSTDGPWDVTRYNAIFYLLRELVPGDRVIIFYKGQRFDYTVYDKTIVPPSNTSFLTDRYDKPVLTLQTCDPPGTSINRLIVRAQLSSD